MKNIPIFTTEAGIASIVLEEIPYKQEAYIRIQSASSPVQLIEDAVSLCIAAGAELIYATGDDCLKEYPLYTEIIRMECSKNQLKSSADKLRLVTESTLESWCAIYNKYMKTVPNAASMTKSRSKKVLADADAYFVFSEDTLIGIGKASGSRVEAIVSLIPGMGQKVMLSLCNALDGDSVSVEVANNNLKAMSLYRKMGFTKVESLSSWYCVKDIRLSRKNT